MCQHDEHDSKQLSEMIEFSKFGFRGTLTGAIVGLIIVPILAYILKDSQYAAVALLVYCAALGSAVVAFGYFSLRRVPEVVANLLKGRFSIGKEEAHRIEELEAKLLELEKKVDAK